MLSLLAITLCFPTANPAPATSLWPAPAIASTGDRASLEKLLAEEAAKARKLQVELTPRVEALLNSLGSLSAMKPGDTRLAKIEEELQSLGAPATPLMVNALDPGTRATPQSVFVSSRVSTLLGTMPTVPITGRLLEIATEGTELGRISAIHVLGGSTEKERVGAVLIKLFHDQEFGLDLPLLRALSRLGGPHGQTALRQALSGSPELTTEALSALAEYGIGDSLPLVRDLLNSDRSMTHAMGLLRYFQAAEFELSSEDTKGLVQLAADRTLAKTARRAILFALPNMTVDWSKTNSKLLTRTKEDADAKLSQEALVCLARFGHKPEKKELLKPFKEAIEDNPFKASPFEQRGAIYIRLHEYEDALGDYESAIEIHEDTSKNVYASNGAFVGAARAAILDGNIRDASRTLEESSLSTLQLRALKDDPDFAPLVASEKYNGVLRLK